MDLLGNHAVLHGERVERAWRDARLTQIFEGTNQINRLAVVEVNVPALRERKEDIPALVDRFLGAHDPPRTLAELPANALALLAGHDWPGNVRELRNVVARLLLFPETVEEMLRPLKKEASATLPPAAAEAPAPRRAERLDPLLEMPLLDARWGVRSRSMRIQAPHCPSCGAPIEVPEGAARVTCSYCSAALIIEDERVSTRRPKTPPSATEEDDESPYPEPDATLWAKVYPRFELSVIEQRVPQAVPELFAGLELDAERFAFISLRVVDRDGRPQPWPLDAAFEALRASLEADGDPGLAANLALETLCARPFDHRLECAVVLFEPRHMRVTSYAAGVNAGLLWASGEEGRTIAIDGHRSALERKMLRESADHFSNGRPILLAAGDLILIPSAGFMGRGARGYSEGPRVLQEVANAQLGEEPLRVVTLAKNAFWAEFQKQRRSVNTPVGDVRIAAVRAISPPLVTALPQELSPPWHWRVA